MKEKVKSGNNNRGFIGVFDSGFGGLEILREIVRVLPEYDFVYLGDSARAPYGNRPQKQVYEFTKQAVNFLFNAGAELIILACNTVSAEALRKIQQEYLPKNFPGRRVLGVIIPTCQAATELGAENIGVIATKNTVASGAFIREIKKLNPAAKIFQNATPLLVPLIEKGAINSQKTNGALRGYLTPLLKENIDVLILGCTHYGLLKPRIKKMSGTKIKLVSEGRIVAEKLKNYLLRHPEIDGRLGKSRKIKVLTTGQLQKFKRLGGKFFQREIFPEKIDLN